MFKQFKIGLTYGILSFLYISIALSVIALLIQHGIIPKIINDSIKESPKNNFDILKLFVQLVVFAPLIEEIQFRWLPIRLTKAFFGEQDNKILWPVIIVVSILFGLAHGAFYHLFLQGVLGILFSMAFLKGGYLSSVVCHAIYNLIIVILSMASISLLHINP